MKILHTATLLLLIAVAPACGSQRVEFGNDDTGGDAGDGGILGAGESPWAPARR